MESYNYLMYFFENETGFSNVITWLLANDSDENIRERY